MTNTKQQNHDASKIVFTGAASAQKRLMSAGMEVHRLSAYQNRLGNVWEAETNKGRRWVSWSDRDGWKIAKEPPTA